MYYDLKKVSYFVNEIFKGCKEKYSKLSKVLPVFSKIQRSFLDQFSLRLDEMEEMLTNNRIWKPLDPTS